MSDSKEVADLVARLNHLVSLNEPENGGPYGGYAAAEFVKAASTAANTLQSLSSNLERVTAERDAELDRVRRLQAALLYWMPSVRPETDEGLVRSAGDDAYLLAGFDGVDPGSCWGDDMLASISTLTEALAPFAQVGNIVDTAFGPALFPDEAVAFSDACTWSENGVTKALTWGDFRAAIRALPTQGEQP